MVDNAEKPFCEVNLARSKAYSPIAIAGRGFGLDGVLIIPNGMFANEKGHLSGIDSQLRKDILKCSCHLWQEGMVCDRLRSAVRDSQPNYHAIGILLNIGQSASTSHHLHT